MKRLVVLFVLSFLLLSQNTIHVSADEASTALLAHVCYNTRNNVLGMIQPITPFILPPLFLLFGYGAVPFTSWIAGFPQPFKMICTNMMNAIIFLFAPVLSALFTTMCIPSVPFTILNPIIQFAPSTILTVLVGAKIEAVFSQILPGKFGHVLGEVARCPTDLFFSLLSLPLVLLNLVLVVCLFVPSFYAVCLLLFSVRFRLKSAGFHWHFLS